MDLRTRRPRALLLLFAALAASAARAERCDAPYKTLSSDCRDGAGVAAASSTVCVVIEGSVGLPCDVLKYQIEYHQTQARFHIAFSDADPDTPSRRRLVTGSSGASRSDDAGEPPTGPPTLPPTGPPVGTRVDDPTTYSPSTAPPQTTPHPPAPPVPTDKPTDAPATTTPPVNPDGGGGIASDSNDVVEAIGPLHLDPALAQLKIIGGSTEFGTRGKTVKLRIDPRMLEQSPSVSSVRIVNCNIGEQVSGGDILSRMPSGLTDLSLANTLLRTEPTELSSLRNLKSLKLSQNFLPTISSTTSLPKLTELDASDNELISFEATFPALKSLFLNKNKFVAIPSTVYFMNELRELQLTENPIVAIVVSTTQYDFISTNVRLKLDKLSTLPPSPEVYATETTDTSLPLEARALDLTQLNAIDLSSAVAVPVGTLTDLQGHFVWKLSDAVYEIFSAQQQVIANNKLYIAGIRVQPYLVQAAILASRGSGSTDQDAGIDQAKKSGGTEEPTQAVPSADSTSAHVKPSKTHTGLIVSLVCVAVVGFLSAMIFVLRRRKHTPKTTDDSLSNATTPRGGSSEATYQVATNSKRSSDHESIDFFSSAAMAKDAHVRDLFSSRRIRTKDLEDIRPIGAGAIGVVWLVKWRGARLLASKRLIQTASTSERMNKFVNEVVIAADLDYPHIVRLIGVSWTNETDLQALYEYMPNRDLQTYLHNNTSPDALSWSPEKLQMAIDIVEALVYTHSFNPPLVHRDLRTRNVLLDEHMRPKLTNFGSARFASEQNTMTTNGVGSARWLAPEILNGSTDYDDTSDMYAFGVLLCELDTHASPYEGVRDARGELLTETALMELVADGALRPSLLDTCPTVFRDLVTRCVAQNPAERPSAMQVAYELRLLMKEWKQKAGHLH